MDALLNGGLFSPDELAGIRSTTFERLKNISESALSKNKV
jgi:hypothetical protein